MYFILYLYGVGIGRVGNFQGYRQWIKKTGQGLFFPGKHFGL